MPLFLIRHGDFIDNTDAPLSPAGVEQVRRLSRHLIVHRPAAIFSSPIRRAVETAALLAAPFGLQPIVDPRWTEADFGDPANPTPISAEGESLADVIRRATAAMADYSIRSDETIFVVTHADVIAAAVSQVLSMPAAAVFRLQPDTASNTILRLTPTPALLRFNSTGWQ